MACHGVVRIFLGWQWQGERVAVGVLAFQGAALLISEYVDHEKALYFLR